MSEHAEHVKLFDGVVDTDHKLNYKTRNNEY